MEVAISNLVQTAIYAVTNLLNEPKGYILNAKDDLEKLQMKLKKFQKEIKDADLKPFFSKERDRVLEAELKDVLYDAEDIIQGYQSKIEASKRDQQSWALFLNVALRKGQTEQDLVMHNIKEVGVSIVKKCGGLPLVIKTVGSMMLTKQMNREDWKSIEDSKIWEWKTPAASSSLSEIGGDILPGLILSYDDLPYHLKSCFVYCCIHPKDYEIEREILIMQWVAHGLIEEKKHIDVEATANQYIQDLIRRCLIEENNKSYYASPRLKLHDILYDLASYIGGEEYSHASTSQRTRHMSILAIDNVKEAMHNATTTTHKLRTLLTKSLPLVHLTNFKWLRMLSLMEYRMEELPNSIGDLALLKYLDLSWSHVRRLPTSIDTLCSLQTLDLSHSRIEELPKEMGELCNLRYLGLEGTLKLKFIAEGFGKLTNLRTLHRFLVCNDKKDTKGCNIWEIKDLKKLKGKLSIEGLGRSRNAIDHVGNAKLLKEKHGIISLEFDFGITGDEDKESGTSEQSSSSEQSGVLEALEPPVGLECLTIRYYKGKVPAGLSKTDCYTMLRSLKVIDCPALREIASTPALESLVLHGCNWEGWPAGGSEETTFTSMRSLRVANFRNCPKMQTQGLIDELAGLQRLIVRDCPSARLGWKLLKQLPNLIVLVLDSESAVLVPSPLPSQVSTFLPSLKELCLIDNTNVDGLKWGRVPEWVWGLSQLEILHLYSFSGDISLGGHWQCLPKLRSLWLFDFPNLKFVVEVNNVTPQQQQNGTTCPSDAQQQQIACLSNLHSLWIHSCPALELPQELNDHLGERIVKD
ncbi:putative disease resistance protein [Nymphaea thermarum]|nr:putative disease resistance protein [Nymphaea thermarum]